MTDVSDWGQWDRDRYDREPAEPDWDARAYEEHCEEVHGGQACDCPPPTPEEIEASWAERARQHVAEDHGGGECDCTAPFLRHGITDQATDGITDAATAA